MTDIKFRNADSKRDLAQVFNNLYKANTNDLMLVKNWSTAKYSLNAVRKYVHKALGNIFCHLIAM